MADLTEVQSSQAVKVVGSDLTGVETYPVGSTSTGEIKSVDAIGTSVINGSISVSTTQVKACVGASNLVNRKVLTITPTDGFIYFGSTGVSTANGTKIFKNQTMTVAITDAVNVYLIASSGTVDVRIIEGS